MKRERVLDNKSESTNPNGPAGSPIEKGETASSGKPQKEVAGKVPNVDALAFEFLEELDAVSDSLKAPPEPGPGPPLDLARKPDAVGSGGNIWIASDLPTTPGDDLTGGHVFSTDVDAELARTLDELESLPKSHVVPLPIRKFPRPRPPIVQAPEPILEMPSPPIPPAPVRAATVKQHAEPEVMPTISTDAATELATPEDLGPVPYTFVASTRWPRIIRKVAIGLAAAVLIVASAAAFYHFLVQRPNPTSATSEMKPPSRAVTSPASMRDGTGPVVGEDPTGVKTGAPPMHADSAAPPLAALPPLTQARGVPHRPESLAPQPAPGRAAGADARGLPARATPVRIDAAAVPSGTPVNPVTPPPPPTTEPATKSGDTPPIVGQVSLPPTTPVVLQKATLDIPPAGAASLSNLTRPPATLPIIQTNNIANPDLNEAAEAHKMEPPSVTFATVLKKTLPRYPAYAAAAHFKGTVNLVVEIDEHGKVIKATAINGSVALRAAAEEAVMQWLFKPATVRGVPIGSSVNISVVFN